MKQPLLKAEYFKWKQNILNDPDKQLLTFSSNLNKNKVKVISFSRKSDLS